MKRPSHSRRLLWRALAGAVVTASVFAVALYAAFWVPYRKPAEEQAPLLELVRRAEETGQAVMQVDRQHWDWVDREQGIVQIPIEEAMRVVAEQADDTDAGEHGKVLMIPTDAGSGRFVVPTRGEQEGADAR